MTDNEDATVTIDEYIQSIDDQCLLVMGGIESEDTCTFTQGYVKRQAIFTCFTCLKESGTKAGFCYPCSVHCHSGHNIIELYTKRRFRCDCGNSKFRLKCQLWEEKDDENYENKYDQNFSNLFCRCSRPYPDDSYQGDEEMFQCVLCEDWFHIEHLNISSNTPYRPTREYEELTCHKCVFEHPFLSLYVLNYKEMPFYTTVCTRTHIGDSQVTPIADVIGGSPLTTNNFESPTEICLLEKIAQKFGLKLQNFQNFTWEEFGIADMSEVTSVFWSPDWRSRLCTCCQCKHLYSHFGIEFLLEPEDRIEHYTYLSERKQEEMEKGADVAISETLSELPHSVAVNVAQGITHLRMAFEDFIAQKRDSGHVITESEVRSYFDKLKDEDWWPH